MDILWERSNVTITTQIMLMDVPTQVLSIRAITVQGVLHSVITFVGMVYFIQMRIVMIKMQI